MKQKIKVRTEVLVSPYLRKGGCFASETSKSKNRNSRKKSKLQLRKEAWL